LTIFDERIADAAGQVAPKLTIARAARIDRLLLCVRTNQCHDVRQCFGDWFDA
jgi:hypothetical protein